VQGPALLFCPADRADRYHKAAATADTVILDLEDGVDADRREIARAMLVEHALDPQRTIVRVNPAGSADFTADIVAVRVAGYHLVMLAKSQTADDIAAVRSAWTERQPPGSGELGVIALCETPLGVVNAAALAASESVIALMWGAEDLVAAMRGWSSRWPNGGYRDFAVHARSSVLLAAHAFRRAAVDAVVVDLDEQARLRDEACDAAASGFTAKGCIHPRQVSVVRAAFAPTPAEIAWAERVLALAGANGTALKTGARLLDGQMVDGPAIRRAEALLRRVSG
jgi:citrate lyase subunit beta/citryl-CoA lyase